jgi:glycosyltransferase involved in cell wall biosynthesis
LRFRFAGAQAPKAIAKRLANSKNAEVLGFVDSIADEIDRASLVLSPLRLGRGVRIKNLEAMARGAPLVTTVLGAQGLFPDSCHSFVATDSPDSLAESITRLLIDQDSAEAMGQRGRTLIAERFSPEMQLYKTLSLWRGLRT